MALSQESSDTIDVIGLPHALRLPSGTHLRTVEAKPYWIAYKTEYGQSMILLASYDTEAHGRLLHLSLSWPHRVPSWPEILDVQGGFAPSLPMMMVLPTPEKYVNMHPYTLNLYQVPDGWLEQIEAGQAPPPAPHPPGDGIVASSNGAWVTLTRRDTKPRWNHITAYRDAAFDPARDVMVWWDHPRKPKAARGAVFLAYTPEPWQAGFFVGAPGVSPTEARQVVDAARREQAWAARVGKRR